jgi:hypothetical protein
MSKIPVGRTISQTYGFAIGWFFPLLGVVWLPFLILGLVGYFYFLPALAAMTDASQQMVQQLAQHNPQSAVLAQAHMGQFMGRIYAFNLVTLIVFSVIAVGISKEALGLRKGPRFVYLDIGKRELLVMAGFFVVFVLFYVALVAVGIVGGIVAAVVFASHTGASGGHLDPVAMGASMVKIVLPVVAIAELISLYFVARLTYLMVPVTTAEGHFGVWQSWRMTRGNFWRIVGVAIATLLPLSILQLGAFAAFFGPGYFQSLFAAEMHPLAANPQLSVVMHKMVQYSIYGWVAGFVIAPISYGLMFGQAAFAYRALTRPAAD